MTASAERARRLRPGAAAKLAVYLACWFVLYGAGTATGFWLFEEGSFTGGGVRGVLVGGTVLLLDRAWSSRSSRQQAPAG